MKQEPDKMTLIEFAKSYLDMCQRDIDSQRDTFVARMLDKAGEISDTIAVCSQRIIQAERRFIFAQNVSRLVLSATSCRDRLEKLTNLRNRYQQALLDFRMPNCHDPVERVTEGIMIEARAEFLRGDLKSIVEMAESEVKD